MKNQQKGSTSVIILVVIIIILLFLIGYMFMYQPMAFNQGSNDSKIQSTQITTIIPETTVGTTNINKTNNTTVVSTPASVGNCGLNVTSIPANSKVAFPTTISGTANNSTGCSWSMFEGQAGIAQLYFNYQNEGWKKLGVSAPVKVADWTADKTQFSVTLNFNNGGIGLPSGTPLKIVFTAENASGLPGAKTSEFPLILK